MPSSNVHFRNLTAAHVDDDHGGCGQHSGPLRRGSPHVYVQNRPLVREKDLPSCAGRPDHEPAPHCHVGEGGGSAITTARRGGVQSAPRKKCTSAGHPVDVATGRVFTRDPLHHLSPLRLLVPPANPRPSSSVMRVAPAASHSATPPKYSIAGFGRRVIGADGRQGSFHNFGEDITGKAGPHGHMGAFGATQTFFNHIGSSLGDGAVGVYDHATGDTDGAQISQEDANRHDGAARMMLKGTLGGDHGLVATAGQAAADKLYAQEYPAAAAELNQDAAGQRAKAKAGVIDQAYNDPFGDLAIVAPVAGAGRLAALGRLGKALEAANAAGDGARAARIGKAMEALRGGKAGAAAREAQEAATKKLSANGQATLAKAQAAVAKHRERKLNEQEHKLNAQRMASPGEMQERWRSQESGGQLGGHGQPALAGVSGGGGKSSRAIGKPEGKSGMMQMTGEGAEGEATARKLVIKPTGEAKGKPTGMPEECDSRAKAEKKRNIARQNEAADALAYHGYKVEHKPKVAASDHLDPGRDPDYRIEGQIFDCYTPTKDRTLDKIRNEISKKVKEGQANHIVLNLTDNPASVKDINRILTGHKEVTGSTYGPLSQILGVRPKPGAQVIGVEAGTKTYAPQDMDVFQIFP